METPIDLAARRLASAQLLVVLTGAGVSKESGIPTFREAQDGLWSSFDPMQMASERGFRRNPRLVWEWYQYRFGMVAAAQPNAGHYAIAELEKVMPSCTVVTQNIDGLHQAAGSSTVLELHGSIRRYKCLGGRHTGFELSDFAGQPHQPPRCPECGDLLRPDVVWFGEYLPEDVLRSAFTLSERCDAMLVVGTSGVVQPAASLPFIAAQGGALVIDINPDYDEIARVADVFLQGKGGEVLPQLVRAMKARREGGAPRTDGSTT